MQLLTAKLVSSLVLPDFLRTPQRLRKLFTITLAVSSHGISYTRWRVTQAGAGQPTTTTASTPSIGAAQVVDDFNKSALAVTISQIVDPASGTDEFNQPNTGYRFVAVQLALANESRATISDDANSDVQLIGSDNQAYTADFDSVVGCTNFSYGEFTLLPGGAETGCVVFQLPTGVNTKLVQFSLGYGFLNVAQWSASS